MVPIHITTEEMRMKRKDRMAMTLAWSEDSGFSISFQRKIFDFCQRLSEGSLFRFKTLMKYEYNYIAESQNSVSGTSTLKSGLRVNCKVEIEVPRICSFLLHTKECSLTELSDTGLHETAPNSLAFKTAMERLQETVHGMCETEVTVNAREDIATEVSVVRDLSNCDQFRPVKDFTSPLALISGMVRPVTKHHYRMNTPLSTLIDSMQVCNYTFDKMKKHMTSGACSEKHIFLPFSQQQEYGILTLVKQNLTLLDSSKSDNTVFNPNEANRKALYMEFAEDKDPSETADSVLRPLKKLSTLSQTQHGSLRAPLFQRVVTEMRRLSNNTLSASVKEMMKVSSSLTWQALAQCGTPECISTILQILRTFDRSAPVVDITVYALGLLLSPNGHHVRDMLSIAQFKQSKAIMYGLSNSVRKLYRSEQKVTPEITAVSEFMASLLGTECNGNKDMTFLTLRVLGNMGEAMEAARSSLKTVLLQCVSQPAAPLPVQQAAIQALRQMTITAEVRHVLLQIVLDSASPLQKRVAAYLILMRDPEAADIAQVINALPTEKDPQAQSFIASYLANILSSNNTAYEDIKQKIIDALQDNKLPSPKHFREFSQNYKMGVVQGNVLFDSSGYMPKEVMLEATLQAYGLPHDMFEIGMQGKGLEPAIEALFGQNGFFPNAVLTTISWVEDRIPQRIREVLKHWMPLNNERMKKPVPQNIMKEIRHNFYETMKGLRDQHSPEVTAYLKIFQNDFGHFKTSELHDIVNSALLLGANLFPKNLVKSLLSNTDNEIFAHYIFMDNKFFLPTSSGFPLRFSLSGTFAPGAMGGFHVASKMETYFQPFLGVDFETQMGVHIPSFVISGIRMHTNFYHESAFNPKLSMSQNQVKLTLPAPKGTTKLFSISNKIYSLTSLKTEALPSVTGDRSDSTNCSPLFLGVKYCTTLRYTDTSSAQAGPYFPLNAGESEFAVEIQPTGDITEYTATFSYDVLKKGKDGQQDIDTVKMTLKAEGAQPSEATATVKYNRNRNALFTDIQVPDYDVEAGIRSGVTDSTITGKGMHTITLDIVSNNVPQLSLLCRGKIEQMRDSLLQVQLNIPAIETEAALTVTMNNTNDLTLELESSLNISEITSLQKVILRYDGTRAEVELKSDLSSEVQKQFEDFQNIIDRLMDQAVAKTGLKSQIFSVKSIEAISIWLRKVTSDLPYVGNLNVPEFALPSLPEKLFLNFDSKLSYQFSKDHYTITIPVPLGGKSSEDINIPKMITIPRLTLPQTGLEFPAAQVHIPTFSLPHHYNFMLPLPGLAEFSAKVNSNFYNWEASFFGGKDTSESYFAKYKVMGDCPVEVLSYSFEGNGLFTKVLGNSMKAVLDSSLSHKLIDASLSITEIGNITDKVILKTTSRMKVSSPLGLDMSLYYVKHSAFNFDEITGDIKLDGVLRAGPLYGNSTYSQSFIIYPFRREARGESTLKMDSSLLQANNKITAVYAKGALSIISATDVQKGVLRHMAELSYKNAKFFINSDVVAKAFDITLRNQADFTASYGVITAKIESQAEGRKKYAYSLFSGSLGASGLEMNYDGFINFTTIHASHKATLTFDENGLSTKSTTNVQHNLLTFENFFNGVIDVSGTTLSLVSKGSFQDLKTENNNTLKLTLTSLAFHSMTENFLSDSNSYKQYIYVNLKPFITAVTVNNNLKLQAMNLVNEVKLNFKPKHIQLTGHVQAACQKEKITHTYEISFAELIAKMKFSTNGEVFGANVSHISDLEVKGLSAKFNSKANLTCKALHFRSTVNSFVKPFVVSVEAVLKYDSELHLFGMRKGELYSNFLLKAGALGVAHSHVCRASTTHELIGETLETYMDHKTDSLLTPQEQKLTWKVTSKLNQNTYSQEIRAYNNPERIGMEMSGTADTNLLGISHKEFSISGLLKYEKNSESHIIDLPVTQILPETFEHIKKNIVSALESLKNYTKANSEKITTRLEGLLDSVGAYVSENHVENKIHMINQNLIALTKENILTLENLEAALEKVTYALKTILTSLENRVKQLVVTFKDLNSEDWYDFTADFFTELGKALQEIDSHFPIRTAIVRVINTVKDFLNWLDMVILKDSSICSEDTEPLCKLKSKFIMEDSKLKQAVKSFDIMKFTQDLRNSFHLTPGGYIQYIENIVAQIPTEEFIAMLDNITLVIINIFETYVIKDKINEMPQLIVFSELGKKMEAFLDRVGELIKEYKIKETIQSIIKILKSIDLPTLSDKVDHLLNDAIDHVRAADFKQMIDQLNEYIDYMVNTLKTFDYNTFVQELNKKIGEVTRYCNKQIQALEVPQKIEASLKFIKWIQESITDHMEQLKKTKAADIVLKIREIINVTAINTNKVLDSLKERIFQMDIEKEVRLQLQIISHYYDYIISYISEKLLGVIDGIHKFTEDHETVNEMKQIVGGFFKALKTADFETLSFTVPLTDLFVPPIRISFENLQDVTIPTQITIPEYTVIGLYTIPATTIEIEEIRHMVINLIDSIIILYYQYQSADPEAFLGDIKINYPSVLSNFTLLEIDLSQFSFAEIVIPKLNVEDLDTTKLQIPEIKLPPIPSNVRIPAFGKLYGEIKFNSPGSTFLTLVEVSNTSVTSVTPQITAYIISNASSTEEVLDYTLEAMVLITMPKMSRFVIKETVKVRHLAFSVEHQGSVTIYGTSVEASGKTSAKAYTEPYTAELVNSAFFALESGMTTSVDTTYSHNLNITELEISSQVTGAQKIVASLESGVFSMTVTNRGNEKLFLGNDSEEDTHKSELNFTSDITTTKITFTAQTVSQDFRMNQTLNADCILFSQITVDGRVETKTPFLKISTMTVSGNVNMGDLRVELTAVHNAELTETTSGTISNTFKFLAHPYEAVLDLKSKDITRFFLPLKLSAKVDFQNDFIINFNSEVQHFTWFTLAQFNKYKYFHSFTLNNNNKDVGIHAKVKANANLDFLTIPLTIPELDMPLIGKTPSIGNISLWAHTGLKNILTTTKQSLDMDFYIEYQKSFDTLGNLTSGLSFKSAVVTLNVSAGFLNQNDTVARFGASSTSVFEALTCKLIGISSLTTKRGIKLATALSLQHKNIEVTHESTINSQEKYVEASVTTVARCNFPIINLQLNQKLTGSSITTPSIESNMNLEYSLNLSLIDASGDVNHTLKLDALASDFSLETANKGKIDGTIMTLANFSGTLNQNISIYLSADALRSTLKTVVNSSINLEEAKIWNMDTNQNLALETSHDRLYAVLTYNNDNEASFCSTHGKHLAQVTLDVFPKTSVTVNVDIEMSQPNSAGEASLTENIVLDINDMKQRLIWKGREQLTSLVHTYDLLLSSDETDMKMEVSNSLEGYASFLKEIQLPVYQKDLWEVLKFDQVTREENTQTIQSSCNVTYSKKNEFEPESLSTTVKLSSPIYSTTWTAKLENKDPKLLASLKSSCTSTMNFLEFNLDATETANFHDNTWDLNGNGTFTHTDMKINWEHIHSQPLSVSHHTLNVEISSSIFTDSNSNYTSLEDGVNASISIPPPGFFGFLLESRTPSEMYWKLYNRYPSAPENDVDILTIKMFMNNSEMMDLQTSWNIEAPNEMITELKGRVPVITNSLYNFVNKYHKSHFGVDIESIAQKLKNAIANSFKEAYILTAENMTDPSETQQLCILLQKLFVLYRKTTLAELDAMIKFLRETQIQVPAFTEKLTIPELCQKIKRFAATVLDQISRKTDDYLDFYFQAIINQYSDIEITMPAINQVATGKEFLQFWRQVMTIIQYLVVEKLKNLECFDEVLEDLRDFIEALIE
ncbi:apolipoprotein B-100-like, partial [Scleropages formosus]